MDAEVVFQEEEVTFTKNESKDSEMTNGSLCDDVEVAEDGAADIDMEELEITDKKEHERNKQNNQENKQVNKEAREDQNE